MGLGLRSRRRPRHLSLTAAVASLLQLQVLKPTQNTSSRPERRTASSSAA